jgi:MerR family transcriptional regulator, repressor of the yfmOP operon
VTLAPIEPAQTTRYLRIQEVAAETGLTPRTIRYYEEQGLLTPVARSEGSYRLYDEADLERLRFIKGLRDDAGFSLAEIGRLLEDEAARRLVRERYRATDDPAERRALLAESLIRADRQIATLRDKAQRLDAMIADAAERRAHLLAHLAELDGGPDPHPAGREVTRGGRARRSRR